MFYAIWYGVAAVLSLCFWFNRRSYHRFRRGYYDDHSLAEDVGFIWMMSCLWPATVLVYVLYALYMGVWISVEWSFTAPGKWLANRKRDR